MIEKEQLRNHNEVWDDYKVRLVRSKHNRWRERRTRQRTDDFKMRSRTKLDDKSAEQGSKNKKKQMVNIVFGMGKCQQTTT